VHVFATAGHVDHGKSTLVRALTGRDPDRLEEEQRRGLSIQLGYCWTSLPGVGDLAFVDVPGHERFITTTLAGVGPVSAVMFVVAADDPWMPQAAEHLAALDALGVRHGVLVVTRADLADPAAILSHARAELRRTSLGDLPALVVSGRTGQGVDALRDALAQVAAQLPVPDPRSDVRLWVDRRFHVRGTGTVVTGTLPEGTITVGDTLQVAGDAALLRVRGIECLGQALGSVAGVARVALDVGGKPPDALGRGTALVTPGAFEPVGVVDVRLSGEGPVPQRPVLHVGSAAGTVHARPLGTRLPAPRPRHEGTGHDGTGHDGTGHDGTGHDGTGRPPDGPLLRLGLDRPLPLRIGDRAILRDPGSRAMWGVEVLDPAPPPLHRRGAAAARVRELAKASGSVADEVDRRGVVRRSLLRRVGARDDRLADGTLAVGDWLVSPRRTGELRRELAALVADRGTDLLPGVSTGEAVQALHLPGRELLDGLLGRSLRLEDGRVVPDTAARLPPRLDAALAAIRADLTSRPFAAPDAARLAGLGVDTRDIAVLARGGHVLRLEESLVLLPGADDVAVSVLAGLPQPFSTSQARQALGTSRRVALPLLAHLDRTGRTRRGQDDRRSLTGR
jgi:selenocysteine-specific elongation factor